MSKSVTNFFSDGFDIARILHGIEKTPEISMIPGVYW
jgi:hypothetical protein